MITGSPLFDHQIMVVPRNPSGAMLGAEIGASFHSEKLEDDDSLEMVLCLEAHTIRSCDRITMGGQPASPISSPVCLWRTAGYCRKGTQQNSLGRPTGFFSG